MRPRAGPLSPPATVLLDLVPKIERELQTSQDGKAIP